MLDLDYRLWSMVYMIYALSRVCLLTTARNRGSLLLIEATSLNMALLQRDQLKIKELTAKLRHPHSEDGKPVEWCYWYLLYFP